MFTVGEQQFKFVRKGHCFVSCSTARIRKVCMLRAVKIVFMHLRLYDAALPARKTRLNCRFRLCRIARIRSDHAGKCNSIRGTIVEEELKRRRLPAYYGIRLDHHPRFISWCWLRIKRPDMPTAGNYSRTKRPNKANYCNPYGRGYATTSPAVVRISIFSVRLLSHRTPIGAA